ncbi:MAG: tripartite tricarboxylate transporter substrate binding protein [Burkholderiales bacterium]|nr:tripartite tricarboxylate transporter substrate binding protein [Burkholderiales bacterium]
MHASGHSPRRRAVLVAALAGAGSVPGSLHASDAWPARPVRIIVPFAPGGPADGSARVLAEAMAPALGQNIVVENRPGAGGMIGITAAAQAKDAHTLLMGSTSMVVTPALNPNVTYDVFRDFDPIGMVSAQPLVLVVSAAAPHRAVADLIAEARANPGRLSFGNSGNGTLAHLTAELFAMQAGVTITSVPYKGESALLPDLIAGTVGAGFINLPSVLPQARAGKLRAIAVSTAQPIAELPGVPAFKSAGIANLEVQGWAALLAARGIPAEALARLEGLLATALASEAVKKRFADFGVTPVTSTRAGLTDYLKSEAARWGDVVRSRGIKGG